ncbi:MAG: DUF99 family protein, partial [Thermoplasmata archaeon]
MSLARALAKEHVTVAAFDDGPFRRGDRWAALAGVLFTTPGTVAALALGRVRVDRLDVTSALLRLLRRPGFERGARAIVLDGISFAGFNLVDLPELARAAGRPVLTVTRDRPDRAALRRALRRYFPRTAEERERRLRARPLFPVDL